jgi:hypothetical protein
MLPNSSNHNNHPPEASDYISADSPVDSASVAASDTAFVAIGARTVGARIGCSRAPGRLGVDIWDGWLGREGYWMVWGLESMGEDVLGWVRHFQRERGWVREWRFRGGTESYVMEI